jgi:hypothetical protein
VAAGEDLLLVPHGPVEGDVAALDRRTGLTSGSGAWGPPLLGTDDGVLSQDHSGRLGMRSLEGDAVWSDLSEGYAFAAFSVGEDRAVTVGESTWDVGGPDELTARVELIDLSEGDVLAAVSTPSGSGVAVRGTAVYVSDPLGRGVRRLDVEGDDLVETWTAEVTGSGSWLMATERHVVVAGAAGAVVLDTDHGREIRRLASDRLAPHLPALRGTTLRVADNLNVIHVANGEQLARVDLQGVAAGAPLVADGDVYIALVDGAVVALR